MDDRIQEDRSLVERVQSGDDGAFNELLDRYQRPVVHFLYRMLGNAEDTRDAGQEVFVRVYRRVSRFAFRTGRARFSTWLFQIARNVAIDHLRRRRRRPEETIGAGALSERAAANTRTAAADAAAHELGEEIAAAVAELPEEQRTALVLAEYQDLSYDEIARVLRCSVKSVESRLYRAKRFLRKRLHHLMET